MASSSLTPTLQLRRPRWLGLAFALTAIAQLCVLLVAAATSADEALSAVSHVDVSGTAKHAVHDESHCIACAARSVTALGTRAVPIPLALVARRDGVPAEPRYLAPTQRRTPSAPRAPPTSL